MSPVTVSPILPCGDCVHLAVCAIRPLLAPIAESADVPGIESPHEAIRITIDLRVDCSHFLGFVPFETTLPVSGVALNIPVPIPVAVPDAPGDSEAPPQFPPKKWPEPSASRRADKAAVVTRRAARPLGPPMAACEPGCGDEWPEEQLGAHRRDCEAYAAAREGKVRVVGGQDGPAPLHPASVAAIEEAEAERQRFAERRREAASEAADRTWAERHPGEERPLTATQTRILDAVRASEGNQGEAARALGHANSGYVNATISTLRERGRLPADVAEMLDRRKAAKGRAS